MENKTLLYPEVGLPEYVSKDGMWAAIPYGKKYMILSNGKQIDVFKTYDLAVSFIDKKVRAEKRIKKTKTKATLQNFE